MAPATSDLRWQLDGADPQGELFEQVERHVGRGEFRGMEFLHVQARRIINEVPKSSRMPFRHTINAYRGCSHACTYCLVGDTPVLLANGRTKPLADLKVDDLVYGTVRRGAYRRYVPTPVLAHWSTVEEAYRVTLEDGTALVAGGAHRFLTERGWKHVTGSEQGRARRPHLTPNNKLIGTGRFAPTDKEHGVDYRQGYLCGMVRGDGHIDSYAYERVGRANGDVHRFRLALVDLEPLHRSQQFLASAGVPTTQFLFQAAAADRREAWAIRNSSRGGVQRVRDLVAWPRTPTTEWCKGFLAGIFDAEGSYSRGTLRIANTDVAILDRVQACLRVLGFRCILEGARVCKCVRLVGGLHEHLRFFHAVDPATTRKRTIDGQALKSNAPLRVCAVEALSVRVPMYDITTGTGDFIADGVVSHNCFARPTHEYLGLNAGEDFERRIVVKVNAVERVRAELAPGRWAGDHIAMGTNTDPYQRCEGKYRLTRGIIGELTAAANPFSVLTKSTLVLSDLDLLADAARRTRVRANLSIGTLDDDVWRATEPGTPHPLKRVEAVARLNDAGVPCGVLLAPVLPGLSDEPAQLEAVVKACVEAGARSITPLLLHLRAGVREEYLGWLADARPDLVERYARLYPRAYAPRRTQDELSRTVAAMVQRHGGRMVRPDQAREVLDPPGPPRVRPTGPVAPPPARQLGLGL